MESDTDKYCLCWYDDKYREYLFYCEINKHYCGFKYMESIENNTKVIHCSKIEIEKYIEEFRKERTEKFCKNLQAVEYSKFTNEYNMHYALG